MLSVGIVYNCTDVICVYLLTYLYIQHVCVWVCVCVRALIWLTNVCKNSP